MSDGKCHCVIKHPDTPEEREQITGIHSAENRRILQSALLRGAVACAVRPRARRKPMW